MMRAIFSLLIVTVFTASAALPTSAAAGDICERHNGLSRLSSERSATGFRESADANADCH